VAAAQGTAREMLYKFNLTLRAYIPKEELLDGSWKIPQIIVVE